MTSFRAGRAAALLLLAMLAGQGCERVRARLSEAGPTPITRAYFVAAEEVVWDYAPSGQDATTGAAFDSIARVYVQSGPHDIGRVYKKALYREYTDSTFTVRKPRPPEWEHLGTLGPLVRGVVGDTIRIVFRNSLAFPVSVHPHGVFYRKDSKGAPYSDGTSEAERADDGVPPGATHTYVWPVPDRAGPGPHGPSSVLWMYHSHTHEVRDVASGLVGPMIITAREAARADASPSDVDRELVVAFQTFNENESWFLEENIRTFTSDPDGVTVVLNEFGEPEQMPGFGGNFMETMNGFVFGHLPGLVAREGERVRWYVMASPGFHVPHWHGNTVVVDGHNHDVVGLMPMEMLVADMVPDSPGTWLFHCHVAGHLKAGMQATYRIEPRDAPAVAGTAGAPGGANGS